MTVGTTPTQEHLTKKTTSGLPLRHGFFASPPLHIPNKDGQPYKTELVEVRYQTLQTIKWNWWHLPDDDREPHNHPWDFEATIQRGGYTEERFWVEEGLVCREFRTYRAGDMNVVPRSVYHLVVSVLPRTVTRMVCGPAVANQEWGYLDLETGEHRSAEPDPGFIKRLRFNNRFMIPIKPIEGR